MADTIKSPSQSAPGAASEVDLYTVPASTTAVCSTLVIVNRGASAATYRVSVAIAGAATVNQQYIAFDEPIEATSRHTMTLGFTLNAADVVRVRASTADLSFNLFKVERT